MPRFFGYSFNPLTTYYVYDPNLVAVVLEVHNTFDEKHIYPVRFSSSQTIIRRFHVSPFNDRLGTYTLKTRDPRNGISIELTVVTPKLYASLKSKTGTYLHHSIRVLSLCVRCGSWIFMTFPRILYQAFKLHYQKKLPAYMRPEPLNDVGTISRRRPRSIDLYVTLEVC